MATNFINNLSNTYRGSPSLQNQFATEQDYIDLFDNNKVTPQMAQAYVPAKDTTGIKSITNTTPTIINQGGGGDGPPGAPPGNPSFDYETEAYGLNNMTPEEKGITEAEQKGLNTEKTKNTAMGLMAALSFAFNPVGFFVGRYAKDRYNEYKEKKERELQKEIDAANKAAAQKAAFDRAMANQKGFYASLNDGAGASVSDKSRDEAGDGNQAGATPFAYGGRVSGGGGPTESYFNGGIVSLRRR